MPTCERFHPHEISLRSQTPHENPFFVDLRARVTAPSGRVRVIHGFHDSADTWYVRFCPNELGVWRYVSESSDPQLHGQSGEVECVASTNQAVHGALIVDPHHPHHFLYEDGARPFVLGYEANWLWALAVLDGGAGRLDRFCARIAAFGFNHVFVNTYAHDTSWAPGQSHPEDYGPPPAYAWEGSNEQPDHSRLNHRYWRAFDVMMRALFTHGLTAHLFLRVYNKKVTWPANGSREDDLFFKYVVARYGAFSNVVWDFSKESYNERDKGYCANRLALLRALDGHERLVTTHDDWALHFDQRYGGLLDFVSDQKHDHFSERVGTLRDRLRPIPVINEEFAYEAGPNGVRDLSYHPRVRHTPDEHVLRAWELVFGGGYPGYYYLYTAWDVIRPDDEPPGYALHQRLVEFMREAAWWELEPHPEIVERSAGRCLATPGREYLVFCRGDYGPRRHFDEPQRALVQLPGVHTSLHADWLNPLTGERAQTTLEPRSRQPLQAPFAGPYIVRLVPIA